MKVAIIFPMIILKSMMVEKAFENPEVFLAVVLVFIFAYDISQGNAQLESKTQEFLIQANIRRYYLSIKERKLYQIFIPEGIHFGNSIEIQYFFSVFAP